MKSGAKTPRLLIGSEWRELPRTKAVINPYSGEEIAQVVDDASGTTLVSASSKSAKLKTGGNVAAAKEVGKLVGERAKGKGVTKVVFDRGGYLYHGRIKALADAAREAGLEF